VVQTSKRCGVWGSISVVVAEDKKALGIWRCSSSGFGGVYDLVLCEKP